jgi:hypothetical protein
LDLEMSESPIVREVADKAARRITRKVISALQKMTETLSCDDSQLETTWDEICAQIQGQLSVHWDVYDETVRGIVGAQLASLAKHEREAIWLQTQAGIDWSCEEEETRQAPPVVESNLVDWVTSQHVYAEAANWSNARIRTYLEQSSMED